MQTRTEYMANLSSLPLSGNSRMEANRAYEAARQIVEGAE